MSKQARELVCKIIERIEQKVGSETSDERPGVEVLFISPDLHQQILVEMVLSEPRRNRAVILLANSVAEVAKGIAANIEPTDDLICLNENALREAIYISAVESWADLSWQDSLDKLYPPHRPELLIFNYLPLIWFEEEPPTRSETYAQHLRSFQRTLGIPMLIVLRKEL